MLTCLHCGIPTPRTTVSQRYCPPCVRRVEALDALDARRRTTVRFLRARDMRGVAA